MCGILGVHRSFRPERASAERALDALRWRGPDGARLVQVGEWWLGTARLTITDPASGQPIVADDGRAVALNGAITSAAEDRARFGSRLRTGNDAEILLLRAADGPPEAMLELCGPYAFALVDPGCGRLWLARDPMGEKPLFTASDHDGRVVAFASTLAALRALGIDLRPADDELARFLRFGYGASPRLVVFAPAGLRVAALEPGLSAVDAGRALQLAAPRPRPATPLAAALPAAVARCSTAEVPVGLCLSGGIDSACIAACIAADAALPRVPCYQGRAAGEPGDERLRAAAVARHLGLPFVPVDFDAKALRVLPALTAAAGMPLGDPSIVALHAVAKRAAGDGQRVLLSGEGADELLLGYPRHRAARWLPRRGPGWRVAPRLATGRLARAWRALAARDGYDALLEVAPPGFRDAVLVPELRQAALGEELAPLGTATTLERARLVDRLAYLRSDLLPKLDVATMAAGIEGRCPFLDPEVLASHEATAADPRAVLGKRPLRELFEARLPRGHFTQRKRGFALPLDRWWREDDFLPDLLLERRTLERPHLIAAGLRRMLDAQRAGSVRLGHALYLLVAYELWLRTLDAA